MTHICDECGARMDYGRYKLVHIKRQFWKRKFLCNDCYDCADAQKTISTGCTHNHQQEPPPTALPPEGEPVINSEDIIFGMQAIGSWLAAVEDYLVHRDRAQSPPPTTSGPLKPAAASENPTHIPSDGSERGQPGAGGELDADKAMAELLAEGLIEEVPPAEPCQHNSTHGRPFCPDCGERVG